MKCKHVPGWDCSSNTTCVEICKDGLVVGKEECDAGESLGCLDDCSEAAPYYSCEKGNGQSPSKCSMVTA